MEDFENRVAYEKIIRIGKRAETLETLTSLLRGGEGAWGPKNY